MDGLTLRDVMTRDFVGVNESDSVAGAARLMREESADSAVVLRGSEPVGFVTAGGLLDLALREGSLPDRPVTDVMSDPPPSLRPEASVEDAVTTLAQSTRDHVLVADREGAVGVIDARDLATTHREPTERPGVAVAVDVENGTQPVDREATGTEGYSSQSICEACGALARDLANVNGQLICADCRSV